MLSYCWPCHYPRNTIKVESSTRIICCLSKNQRNSSFIPDFPSILLDENDLMNPPELLYGGSFSFEYYKPIFWLPPFHVSGQQNQRVFKKTFFLHLDIESFENVLKRGRKFRLRIVEIRIKFKASTFRKLTVRKSLYQWRWNSCRLESG